MAYNKKGYAQRAKVLQELTQQYYEPERQNRCYKAVWRLYIQRQFGICYATYLKYLEYQPPRAPDTTCRQPTLFDT